MNIRLRLWLIRPALQLIDIIVYLNSVNRICIVKELQKIFICRIRHISTNNAGIVCLLEYFDQYDHTVGFDQIKE